MQPKPYKDNIQFSMTIKTIIPQQLKKTLVMKHLTKWVYTQNKDQIILIIALLMAALIGYFTASYFANTVNHYLLQEVVDPWYLTFGTVASLVLFIGGFIKGRMKK
jgi:hypothetical protein